VFFGPVAGAIVLTFFSVVVASVTRAWLFYLGLFFIVVVVASPDGLAGFVERHAARLATQGWRRCRAAYLWGMAATLLWVAAIVLAVQWAYAAQFGADGGAAVDTTGAPWPLAVPSLSLGAVILMLAASGALATRYAKRASARIAGRAGSPQTQTAGGSR
jgi:branched-chain amino acid transport system permease protein